MKAKTITVDNYKEFKPSEFIRSFLSDIEVAEKIGLPMDMRTFLSNGYKKNCLPCLGGIACLNMHIDPISTVLGSNVSELGDNIRLGYSSLVSDDVAKLFGIKISMGKEISSICGVIKTKKQFDKLKNNVNYYTDIFEKAGY